MKIKDWLGVSQTIEFLFLIKEIERKLQDSRLTILAKRHSDPTASEWWERNRGMFEANHSSIHSWSVDNDEMTGHRPAFKRNICSRFNL